MRARPRCIALASEHHGKGDHSKAHEQSTKADEHQAAAKNSEMAHKKSSEHSKSK
jgi:hypothetical protein